MKCLEQLIGAQLISIDNDKIIVKKDRKLYTIMIEDFEGDCCGYNDIETALWYRKKSKRNPIITHIEKENTECYEGQSCLLTFFGEDRKLAEINSYSSSGSGWAYGATVTLECKKLHIEEVLSSW
jgi:hypothetical protein